MKVCCCVTKIELNLIIHLQSKITYLRSVWKLASDTSQTLLAGDVKTCEWTTCTLPGPHSMALRPVLMQDHSRGSTWTHMAKATLSNSTFSRAFQIYLWPSDTSSVLRSRWSESFILFLTHIPTQSDKICWFDTREFYARVYARINWCGYWR